MNIRLLKKLDAAIGYISASALPVPAHRDLASPVTSVLLIRPGGIGDAVLLAPVIRSLKKIYPSIHVTVLAEQRNAGAFLLICGVDRLLCYDRPMELLQVLRCSYDVVIDTEQWHRLSAVVARIAAAPVKIGFDTNERRRMFTYPIPYSHDDYEAVNFAHLLKPLGIEAGEVEMESPFLSVPDAASAKIAGLLESLNNEPFVTLFPGASIAERRWGADRFRRVAEMLSIFGIRTVAVGGKEDNQQGEVIAGGGLGLNLAGLTSLSETAAVIQKSSLMLSGDSGVLHIAVGLGVPTVSLFGPGRAKKWAPRGDRHIVINKELPCSPCTTFGTTPPCPINDQCMRDITVDEVVNAVTMLLTSVGAMPSQCCKRDWIETA
ncbi:MAG: glycosyltransferase family 9 protein [Desulfuromonadaceae bacterium]|nr:glycosyltransferase family 9 protein [Desulfuromonadaceae bacterium]